MTGLVGPLVRHIDKARVVVQRGCARSRPRALTSWADGRFWLHPDSPDTPPVRPLYPRKQTFKRLGPEPVNDFETLAIAIY